MNWRGRRINPRTDMASHAANAGYTPTAKLLHWLVTALLVIQFSVAWTMPHIGRNTVPETRINLHFSLGVVILSVIVARLIWRWTHSEPAPADGLPGWYVTAAWLVHYLLYLLLLIIPLLGWANASFRGYDVTLFGAVTMPKLLATRAPGFAWTGDVHVFIATYVLLTVIALHVAAVCYHAAIRRDGILSRMLPAAWQ
jgi:cytochrome b561